MTYQSYSGIIILGKDVIPLADKDTITKDYMQDKETFADAFNFFRVPLKTAL